MKLFNLFSGLSARFQQNSMLRKCNFDNDYYGDQQCQKTTKGDKKYSIRSAASLVACMLSEKAYFQP